MEHVSYTLCARSLSDSHWVVVICPDVLIVESLLWDVTRRRLAVIYRNCGTLSYRSHVEVGLPDLLKIGPICCPETSVYINAHRITSQNSKDLIYTVVEA
jgi:hypothetical protein